MDPRDVRSRQDLAAYLETLIEQLREAEAANDDQINDTTDTFISAASRWVDDMDGYFRNQGEPTPAEPSWSVVAMIFAAALIYD